MNTKLLKLISVFLIGTILLSGCGTKIVLRTSDVTSTTDGKADVSTVPTTSNTVTIATSFYPIYIMTLNVTKDIPNVEVINMTQPTTGCLHDYSATPNDLMNLEDAEFLVINGAGMESFMDKVVKQYPNLKTIDSSIGIELIKGEGDEGDNPHIWVSISGAISQVKNIGEQLAELDPDNAEKYKSNTDVYVKKLEDERDKMHQALDNIDNRDIVTFHESFPYFAKEFNLNIVGVIEREPGSEPSAKELNETITKVQELNVKALFAEPQYPIKAAETIANETGAKIYTLDPAVTGSMDADAYITIMDNNLEILQEALK